MKKTVVFFSVILLVSIIFISGCQGEEKKEVIKEVIFTVEGMHCTGCSDGLTKLLSKEEGIKEAKVTFEPPEAFIKYDENIISSEDILKIIEKAGYSGKIQE